MIKLIDALQNEVVKCVYYLIFSQNLFNKMEMDLLNADPIAEEHLHKLKKLV